MFPFIKIFADLYELRPSFLVWRGYNPPTPFILFILTQLSLNRDEQHHDSEERPSRLQYNFFMSSGYLGPFQTEPPADQAVRRSSRPKIRPSRLDQLGSKIFNSFLNQLVITFIGTYIKPVSSSGVAFLLTILLCILYFSFK